ncbi:hypothetical protein [Wenyingzhuangia aestuarii]|uniref:hypothetical protein n=1 Tax=Wenyingzhuangia aestuarii TaxID=1647582 RepID=UPI0014391A1B|nr:hypothetical protein [Wenyingzhuangia aestuarii]NJB81735.1 hypothetical protein [Wenyingzhuangia aestuarii]
MIKVSYLVSYDYAMFHTSVKLIYDYVDKIIIAIDKDYKTWSGNTFVIPDSFFEEVKKNDFKNKIEIYRDSFYNSNFSPMENETIERNKILKKLGYGWKIQLDVDEYIYDFKKVAKYLNKYWFLCLFPKITPICFRGKWITLYKELPDGYLYIDNGETFPFITNQNKNNWARFSGPKVRNINPNISVIHQSWARADNEILQKINNWGHRDDFDTEKYFNLWKSINSDNYIEFKNIHPLSPSIWNRLNFLASNSITEFIDNYSATNTQQIKSIDKKYFITAIFNKLKIK